MSRRDTIIIAVLINAGLLVVLFSTALKSTSHENIVAQPVKEKERVERVIRELPVEQEILVANTPRDEVDQLLRQFAQPVEELSIEKQPAVTEPAEAHHPFAQELNALAYAQPAPKAVAEPQPVKTASSIEVVVQKGDVLEKIARKHNTTVNEIMKSNQLSSTRLKIGQVLKITTGTTTMTPRVQQTHGNPEYYTVKSGDNPWTIAVKNHIKVEELLRLNHLDAETAKRLKPGDQLRIR